VYNELHGITPQSVRKAITSPLVKTYESDYIDVPLVAEEQHEYLSAQELAERIEQMKREMKQAAAALEFEQAAALRDRLQVLEQRALGVKSDSGIVVPFPAKAKLEAPTGGRRSRGSAGRTGGKAAARGRAARWQR
jgi:excinuclease ABC subunit B